MQSKSDTFLNRMGNESDQLGRNIMSHQLGVGTRGNFDGFEDEFYKGRKPNRIYIPRFRNLGGDSNKSVYKKGYGYQGGALRGN